MKNRKTRIYRSSKHSNYSVINNEVLRREDLSWKAKGIMCYVLSLPDDWEIYLEELEKHATDGRDSFRSGWRELINKGYVVTYQDRGENGKFSSYKTEIRESVSYDVPETDYPYTDKPSSDKPYAENPKLLSTNNTNYLSKLNTDSNNISSTDDSQNLRNRFELIWEQYPKGRKQGKDKSFKAYQRAIKKEGVTDEMILKGLSAYKKQIEIQRTELKFIKQAVTWFTNKSWNDEYVTTSKNQMQFNQATTINMEQYEYGKNDNQLTIDDLPY